MYLSDPENPNSTVLLDADEQETSEFLTAAQFFQEICTGLVLLGLLGIISILLLAFAPTAQ